MKRKYKPNPCLECAVRITCRKDMRDQSLCRDLYEYRHFRNYLRERENLTFMAYKNNPYEDLYAMYDIRLMIYQFAYLKPEEINRHFDYLSHLVKKFMIEPAEGSKKVELQRAKTFENWQEETCRILKGIGFSGKKLF